MKPPTRKRSTTARELHFEEYSRWTLNERQKLLKALEKYSTSESSKIAKMVPTKSETEVTYYLNKLKRNMNRDAYSRCAPLHKKYTKNLENWIQFAHQHVDDDEVGYSSMIGKLLALYGEYIFNKRNTTACFRAIYDYLSGLLLGIQLPTLPPLESAVVLDLLKNCATFLSQSDISFHKKFVLRKYEQTMYPKKFGKDSLLKRLLKEDMTASGSKPSSSCSQDKKIPSTNKKHHTKELPMNSIETIIQRQCQGSKTPPVYKKIYLQKILPNGRKVNVVRFARNDSHREETVSKPQSQESKISECSTREIESSCSSMKVTPKNSSTLKKKLTINPTKASEIAEMMIINNINDKNKDIDYQNKSSKIPSSSKSKKSASHSIGKNSATHHLGGSAVQIDLMKAPAQTDPIDVPVQQNPRDQPTQRAVMEPPVEQIKQELDIITEQNSIANVQENNVPLVSTVAGHLSLPSRDCTSDIQVPNRDTNKEKSSSGSIGQIPGKANVLEVPTKGNVLHLPDGGTLLHLPTGGTLLHLPNGGTIKKEQDGTSLFELPRGSTVQQGIDTLSIFQGPNMPFVPRNSTENTVQKRTILSNLLHDPNVETVQQSKDITNISQTSEKRTILSSLLHSRPHVASDQQKASSSKVLQGTSEGLIPERSSNPQQMVFEVTKSNTTPSEVSRGSPVINIQQLRTGVPTETQTPVSDIEILKRKHLNNKLRMASKRPKTSVCVTVEKPKYKPSVSWLNPINIPSPLINLTQTKQKE